MLAVRAFGAKMYRLLAYIIVMTEAGRLKINASHLQCLSLGFVDGHGEAQFGGKLYPLECKRQVAWDDRNTGVEHIIALGASCYDGRLKKVRHEALHQESCTIAQLGSIKVSQQHDG